jgi:uncharacterized repeat protein (TIGR03803 family)
MAPHTGLCRGGCGSDFGCGTVFELSRGPHGGFTITTLHRFNGGNGNGPVATPIFDRSGSLYGTTLYGGTDDQGTVFELSPDQDGKWTEKVLHSFGGPDGEGPYGALIFDSSGDLYGTTEYGGSNGAGTVFELSPQANGNWKEQVLHSFGLQGKDGIWPSTGLTFDASGNLYGTTFAGGNRYNGCFSDGCGTVFELSPGAGGKWTETVLFRFTSGGGNPTSGVIFDGSGNLYGATKNPAAGVFELGPGESGWTYKAIWGPSGEYSNPGGDLTFDAQGNLYGATDDVVFELQPGQNQWTFAVLQEFNDNNEPGGLSPNGGLIFDSKGNIYGTTYAGGTGSGCTGGGGLEGCGVVFQLKP